MSKACSSTNALRGTLEVAQLQVCERGRNATHALIPTTDVHAHGRNATHQSIPPTLANSGG
jgi:hypothetical protein